MEQGTVIVGEPAPLAGEPVEVAEVVTSVPEGAVVDEAGPQPEPEQDLASRIAHMKDTLGLPDTYIEDLLKLVGTTDLVVVADDSGSMNAVTDPRKINEPETRWSELQKTLTMLTTMLLVVEHAEGFWLKFLNDQEWYKISDKQQLEDIFAQKTRARGKTPLRRNLQPIIAGYGAEEKDTLIVILTDGEPSDCSFEELSQLIRSKPDGVFCSFVMCTDELDVVERYNTIVDPIPGCDITDDFANERAEAMRRGNKLTPYQWLAKMLLVKFPKYDLLDEKRLNSQPCCTLA